MRPTLAIFLSLAFLPTQMGSAAADSKSVERLKADIEKCMAKRCSDIAIRGEIPEIPADLVAVPGLRSLGFGKTGLSDLGPIAAMKSLKVVRLWGEENITDLSPLTDLPIQQFDLAGSPISDISVVAGWPMLERLNLSRTTVADLSALSENGALSNLDLSRSAVTDLSPLKELGALKYLNVSGTKVVDFSPISSLKSLGSLGLGNTGITDLSPVAELTGLNDLDRFVAARLSPPFAEAEFSEDAGA